MSRASVRLITLNSTPKDIPMLILGIAPDLTETGQALVLGPEDAKGADTLDVQ